MSTAVSVHHFLAALHVAVVAVGLLTYVALSRGDRQRRPPSAAIAWVLGMLTFPYVALPLYLLLGGRKVEHGEVPQWHAASTDREIPNWAHLTTEGLGLPPCRGNADIHLAADGAESLEILVDLIGQAHATIDLSVYVYSLDQAGQRILQALAHAATRGVRVNVLLDQVGNGLHLRAIGQAFQAAGIELRWFNPLTPRRFLWAGNLRSHRKYAVIDQSVFWSGGRNLGDAYFQSAAAGGWQDLSFTVSGPIARDAARLFARDWRRPRDVVVAKPEAIGRRSAQLLPSGPDFPADTAHDLLLQAIHRANGRLLIATPYFVPTDPLQQALVLACKRKVALTLVVPARSNHRLADWARPRALRELAQAGADIRLTTTMAHAKVMVVDSLLATCGSVNLDCRSLYLNYELNTVFYDAADIDRLAGFVQDLAGSAGRYTPVRPLWARDVFEGLVRAIAFQL